MNLDPIPVSAASADSLSSLSPRQSEELIKH